MIRTLCIALMISASAFAHSIPQAWLMRNGLTDEQIDQVFVKHPNATVRIDASTWRNIRFNTYRYSNVTNWLGIIGETNDFAKLVVPLNERVENLTASNAVISAIAEGLAYETNRLSAVAESWREKYSTASNRQETVSHYLLEKSTTGTATQKLIYKNIYIWYTNIIENVEGR